MSLTSIFYQLLTKLAKFVLRIFYDLNVSKAYSITIGIEIYYYCLIFNDSKKRIDETLLVLKTKLTSEN